MDTPMPEAVKKLVVMNVNEVEKVAATVDFVFCCCGYVKRRDQERSKKNMLRQRHRLFPTTVLTDGHRMYRW